MVRLQKVKIDEDLAPIINPTGVEGKSNGYGDVIISYRHAIKEACVSLIKIVYFKYTAESVVETVCFDESAIRSKLLNTVRAHITKSIYYAGDSSKGDIVKALQHMYDPTLSLLVGAANNVQSRIIRAWREFFKDYEALVCLLLSNIVQLFSGVIGIYKRSLAEYKTREPYIAHKLTNPTVEDILRIVPLHNGIMTDSHSGGRLISEYFSTKGSSTFEFIDKEDSKMFQLYHQAMEDIQLVDDKLLQFIHSRYDPIYKKLKSDIVSQQQSQQKILTEINKQNRLYAATLAKLYTADISSTYKISYVNLRKLIVEFTQSQRLAFIRL